MNEIVNKIANSALEVFDLEDYYPQQQIIEIDVAQWLHEGFVLKEKEFRKQLNAVNWQQYQNCNIAIYCSSDAILPSWATILVTSHLTPFATKVILGAAPNLVHQHYTELLAAIDYTVYANKSVILKGCSKKPVPESAYVFAIQKLQPFAKSIMYGEACSAVPIFKKRDSVV